MIERQSHKMLRVLRTLGLQTKLVWLGGRVQFGRKLEATVASEKARVAIREASSGVKDMALLSQILTEINVTFEFENDDELKNLDTGQKKEIFFSL